VHLSPHHSLFLSFSMLFLDEYGSVLSLAATTPREFISIFILIMLPSFDKLTWFIMRKTEMVEQSKSNKGNCSSLERYWPNSRRMT